MMRPSRILGQEQIIGGFFEQTFMVSLTRTQSVRIGRTTGLLDEGGVANQVRNVFSGSFAHVLYPSDVGRRRSVMGWNPYRPAGAKGLGKFVTHCCSLSIGTVGCDGPVDGMVPIPASGHPARSDVRAGCPTTAQKENGFYAKLRHVQAVESNHKGAAR